MGSSLLFRYWRMIMTTGPKSWAGGIVLSGTLIKKKADCSFSTYRCLICRSSGAYARSTIDLGNWKTLTKYEFICYKRSGEGFMVKNVCCVLLPATTSLNMPIVKTICCVSLPASWWRYADMSYWYVLRYVLLPTSLWRRYTCVFIENVFIK